MQKKWFIGQFILAGVFCFILIFNFGIKPAKAYVEMNIDGNYFCCPGSNTQAFFTCQDNKAAALNLPGVTQFSNLPMYDLSHDTNLTSAVEEFCKKSLGCFPKIKPTCEESVQACTSWTYTAWSACYQEKKTRTVATATPAGCTGSPPDAELTEACSTSSCSFDDDCTSGKYCNTSAEPDICSAKQADGAACTRPTQCDGGVCSSGKCASSCMFDNNCASNQFCDITASPKACTTKKASGQECSAANQCSGKFCNDGKCASSAPLVCAPACDALHYYCDTLVAPPSCKVKHSDGAACAAANQCDSGVCTNTKCAPAPANCSPACSAEKYCEGTTCKDKKIAGATCTVGTQCTSNLCDKGTCKVTCTDDSACTATEFCNLTASPKTCNTKKSETQACTAANQCAGEACTNSLCRAKCNPGTCTATQFCDASSTPNGCVPKKANDLACTVATECSGGYCTNLKCTSAAPGACPGGCPDGKYCAGTACADKKADGQECSDLSQCTGGFCNSAVCASVAIAESCPGFTKQADCETKSLLCEWVSNACSSKPGVGQPCTFNADDGSDNCRTGEGACITYEGTFLCRKTCSGTDCPAGNYCFDAGGGKFCKTQQGDGGPCTDGKACVSGVCETGKCKGGEAPAGPGIEGGGTPVAPTGYPIPNFLGVDDPNLVVGRIIKYIIGFVGTIALVTFMYGGALWLISAGRMDYVTKGKNYMIWAAVGLAIVFGSYVIVGQIFAIFGQ